MLFQSQWLTMFAEITANYTTTQKNNTKQQHVILFE